MVPDIARAGHSFKGAMAYYLHDKGQNAAGQHLATANRVAWTETRNLATDGPHTAARIMIATASQADELKAAAGVKNTGRKSSAHVYSYSLAWHPDEAEQLDRAEMIRAVDASLKVLGADQHQTVIVCHRDQKHPHVHVIVNRVHPETGRMLSTSNDRLKLSDWANTYERERGQILTPAREVKRQMREAFQEAAQRRHGNTGAEEPVSSSSRDRQKSEAAILKEMSDAQKARHKAEWPDMAKRNGAARDAIYAEFRQRIAETAAAHKTAVKGIWAHHFKDTRRDQRSFDARERTIGGVLRNALDAATHQQASGEASGRGTLALTFRNLLSADARAEAFMQRQAVSRAELGQELNRVLDAKIGVLKTLRTAALTEQREAFQRERAELIERQDGEREKMREAWRQVYARGAKDPRYQARQDAGRSSERDGLSGTFEEADQRSTDQDRGDPSVRDSRPETFGQRGLARPTRGRGRDFDQGW